MPSPTTEITNYILLTGGAFYPGANQVALMAIAWLQSIPGLKHMIIWDVWSTFTLRWKNLSCTKAVAKENKAHLIHYGGLQTLTIRV